MDALTHDRANVAEPEDDLVFDSHSEESTTLPRPVASARR